MKTFTLIFTMLALTFTALVTQRHVVAQKQTPPRLKIQRNVLYDFRVDQPSNRPQILSATQRDVLSKVFRKYLTDESQCNPQFDSSGADPMAAARKAGQIVPSIVDMTTGAFTGRGKQETVFVISVSECNASHADNFGTKRVAIFSGQRLIADLDAEFRRGIVRKTDLNVDGIDELLMTSGDMNQGTLIENASLIEFQNGRLRVIEDFGTVIEDSCASGIPGSSAKASVVSISEVVPGSMPSLRQDNYESSCRRTKRWRFVSSGKMM